MRFLHKEDEDKELTYEDVFLVPQYSEVDSRMDVDITPPDNTEATIPITVANMTSAAGKRMAETVTRRGGLVILTQDTPREKIEITVEYLKSRHPVFETPVVLNEDESIQTALNLIHKRSHGAIIVVDNGNKPIGVFTEADAEGRDAFSNIGGVMTTDIIYADGVDSASHVVETLHQREVPVRLTAGKAGELLGILT